MRLSKTHCFSVILYYLILIRTRGFAANEQPTGSGVINCASHADFPAIAKAVLFCCFLLGRSHDGDTKNYRCGLLVCTERAHAAFLTRFGVCFLTKRLMPIAYLSNCFAKASRRRRCLMFMLLFLCWSIDTLLKTRRYVEPFDTGAPVRHSPLCLCIRQTKRGTGDIVQRRLCRCP